MNKDTIYIDIDDEITSIIDKVQASKEKIVALVLPKRATMLQSAVNMKLLKRSADTAKKKVVLITSEHSLMPLAGSVGLHVAKTLQSKPEVPATPDTTTDNDVLTAEMPAEETSDKPLDKTKPVGELAGAVAVGEAEETIEVDNITPTGTAPAKAAKKAKSKLKIPNFEQFRTRLIVGGVAAVLLLVGIIWAFVIAPRAVVTVTTDSSSITTDLDFTASTDLEEFSAENPVVRAKRAEIEKTESAKAPATGEKDVGTKASGSVTLRLTNCSDDEVRIPSGTAVSTGGLSFITQAAVTLQSVEIGGQCRNTDFPNISSEAVEVEAQNAGEQYNVGSGKAFTVAGFSAVTGNNGSAMSGGTTKIIKVVTDKDVAAAEAKIAEAVGDVGDELRAELDEGNYVELPETETSTTPEVTISPAVGQEATEVTVISKAVHSLYGINQEDTQKLLEDNIRSQIDTSQQNVLDAGLEEAVIRLTQRVSDQELKLSLQTVALAGPEIDTNALREEIAGKKRGEIEALLDNRPGISDVEIDYNPFWVYSTPKSANKISIEIKPVENDE